MPALHGNDIISSHHKVQPDEYEEDDCFSKYGPNIARRCSDSKGHKNRRVHYDDMDDGKRTTRGHGYSDEDEISEHDVGDEAGQGLLDTILLAPPLDMEVQLSPVGSLSDDMNLNVTSENLQTADPKCPPQFRGDEGLIIKPRTSGPTAPLRFNQPGKQSK